MAYLIIIIGIAILFINHLNWNRLRNTALKKRQAAIHLPLLHYLLARWGEWQHFALGDRTLKGAKGLLVALGLLAGLIVVNGNWFGFSLPGLLIVSLPVMVIAQISIGRTLQRRYFETNFPEVLSAINASVSAGNSIHQALHRCGSSIGGPLGKTFQHIDRRLNLGEEPERVLADACREYHYREFYFFAAVIIISMQHGAQLRMLIGRLNRIVTSSRTMSRRKMAMTSEARASAKIVAAIPILFFCGMKYFSPENFDFIINDPTGRIILYYVLASEAIGMTIIWLLLRKAL